MIDRFISDHAAVLCQLDSLKPCTAVKEISHRQLKSIDMDALRADLTTSELCTNICLYGFGYDGLLLQLHTVVVT